MKTLLLALSLTGLVAVSTRAQPVETSANGAPLPVTITVDAAKTLGELKPIWRFFGYDEANYTYMPDGKNSCPSLARWRGRPFISAAIICSPAAMVRMPSNSVPPAPTRRTPTASRSMTGASTTKSSTRISNAD